MLEKKKHPAIKSELHQRNKHRSRYDFEALIKTCPELQPFVSVNKFKDASINFANPLAVRALNKALLYHYYNIQFWELPSNYLCPPIPGRADYIHYIADLLAGDNNHRVPTGAAIKCLDIGVGANCIYPIIGHREYGWSFVGSDTDAVALKTAADILKKNSDLREHIELRHQSQANQLFKGVVEKDEKFDITLCNPPFHESKAKAEAASRRKVNNLNKSKSSKITRNFGGQHSELWCPGGEKQFISNMINESAEFASSIRWFTTLVSRESRLKHFYQLLQEVKATDVVTIPMGQGNKVSRVLAWTFGAFA